MENIIQNNILYIAFWNDFKFLEIVYINLCIYANLPWIFSATVAVEEMPPKFFFKVFMKKNILTPVRFYLLKNTKSFIFLGIFIK